MHQGRRRLAEDEKTIEGDEPDCADHNVYPAPAAYFRELATLDIAEPWMKLDVPLLAIYGSADFITDEADHRRTAHIVALRINDDPEGSETRANFGAAIKIGMQPRKIGISAAPALPAISQATPEISETSIPKP